MTDSINRPVLEYPFVPTGWDSLDRLIGGGVPSGYPECRLTHIHGPAEQVLALTREWGTVQVVDTLATLQRFRATHERTVVDCTSLPHEQGSGLAYAALHARLTGDLNSTIVWLTSCPIDQVPKTIKFCAYLRLHCREGNVHVSKNVMTGHYGDIALPLTSRTL